jgi:hypothetical protein
MSFVDENDEVRYYSDTPERIFPRSPAVIGRKVQNCHPPASVHVVEKILRAFKEGTRDAAEFWIEIRGRFIHIRYFAVRDAKGKYRGTLEMAQDATILNANSLADDTHMHGRYYFLIHAYGEEVYMPDLFLDRVALDVFDNDHGFPCVLALDNQFIELVVLHIFMTGSKHFIHCNGIDADRNGVIMMTVYDRRNDSLGAQFAVNAFACALARCCGDGDCLAHGASLLLFVYGT